MGATVPIVFDLYNIDVTEVDADGFILAKPDYFGEKGGQSLEIFSPYGFYSRPVDPVRDTTGTQTGGCPALVAWHGGEGLVFLGSDPRSVPGLPTLQKGEALFYGPAANFVRCMADGSVAVVCTGDGTATGQTITTIQSPTQHARVGPWGKETFDVNGYHLRTTSGARLDLGGIAGIPSPLDAFANYAKLSAATIDLRSSIISLGPTGVIQDPVAKSTATLAVFAAAQAAIAALGSPGGIIAPPGGGPCTFGPAVATAITALASALTAAQATLPATAVTVA